MTVNERSAAPTADVTGFGDVPLKDLPVSATVIDRAAIERSGARRLADLVTLDPSVADAYDAPGYYDIVSIRGFTLDNRFNFRREGLPINAETAIPLENKQRVEILKGTSGMQAGTSAPGGLVNYVVKRPTEHDLREVRLEYTQRASVLAAADLGGRFGADRAFGYRLNVAHEQLRPLVRNLDGERSLFALAADWRASRDSVLEGEFEIHRRSQPSQAAFSLLGNRLPAPVDPRLNLNNQPWSQPVVFDSVTGTLRFEQAINSQWRWSAQAGTQQLKTQDREAFPFGCSAEGNFDRFCSDGTFDLYDFRSENERRRQDAAQLQLKGKFVTGAVSHDIGFALLSSRVRNRFQGQAYNFVGVGNVQGTVVLPPDPTLGDTNTNRDERSLEFSVNDAMHFGERTTLWLGLRHTQLDRSSITTRNTRATSFSESLTTPWAALSYKITPAVTAYTSWGQGVEVAVVPNRPAQYSNAGQALPALKSRQWEAGLKGDMQPLAWNVALFSITRPVTNLDTCANLGLACTGAFDGEQRHRGVEGSAQWTSGPWRLGGALSVLDAERRGSTIQPAVNGQHPVNVPAFTARLQAGYRFAALPSSELAAQLSHEAKRNVLPDGSLTLPAWTRLDVAFHYDRKIAGTDTRWTVGVDNVADRKYWRESPFQFGHAYLYPGAPRTLRVGVTAAL